MNAYLLVGIGGAFGAMARLAVGRLVGIWPSGWPMATFAVNLLGGLLMGLLSAFLWRLGGEAARLLLGVGVLGGFTTFSAFSLELLLLIDRGQIMLAFTYALASVVLALAAVALGMWAGRALT